MDISLWNGYDRQTVCSSLGPIHIATSLIDVGPSGTGQLTAIDASVNLVVTADLAPQRNKKGELLKGYDLRTGKQVISWCKEVR